MSNNLDSLMVGLSLSKNYTNEKIQEILEMLESIIKQNNLDFDFNKEEVISTFLSAKDYVSKIGVGINLGNTFENSTDIPYEEAILAKDKYSFMGFIISGTSWNGIGTTTPITKQEDGTYSGTLNATFKATTANVSKVPTSINVQIPNYAIGSTDYDELSFTISDAKIKFVSNSSYVSNGEFVVIPNLNGNYSVAKDVSSNGTISKSDITSIEIPLTGLDPSITMENIFNGQIQMKVVINKFYIPSKPKGYCSFYETLLGNPATTKEMIQAIKKKGFNSIRIPISWKLHCNSSNVINPIWISRIKQVVDWCLYYNLKTVINLHHDGHSTGWLKAYTDPVKLNEVSSIYTTLWSQIATEFKAYDHRLAFEGFNEILDETGSWNSPTLEEQVALNTLAQTFLNTVRETGNKNTDRILCINTYGAMSTFTDFVMPKDIASNGENRLMVQVHYYAPQPFCWQSGEGIGNTSQTTYDSSIYDKELDSLFLGCYNKFVKNGYPVVVGEFASYNKNNIEERIKFIKSYLNLSKKYELKCFWWDVGGDGNRAENSIKSGALLNRSKLNWWFDSLVGEMISRSKDTITPYDGSSSIIFYGDKLGSSNFTLSDECSYFAMGKNTDDTLFMVESNEPIRAGKNTTTGLISNVRTKGNSSRYSINDKIWSKVDSITNSTYSYYFSINNILYSNHNIVTFNDSSEIVFTCNYNQSDYV